MIYHLNMEKSEANFEKSETRFMGKRKEDSGNQKGFTSFES